MREAWEVAGGANVSHITKLTPLWLYPAAAIIDPLAATYATSLQPITWIFLVYLRIDYDKTKTRKWVEENHFKSTDFTQKNTYDAWPLKQSDDCVGWTLLLPPTSSCQVHTVPSNAAVANRWPQQSNCNADIDARAYGGGTFAAGRTP